MYVGLENCGPQFAFCCLQVSCGQGFKSPMGTLISTLINAQETGRGHENINIKAAPQPRREPSTLYSSTLYCTLRTSLVKHSFRVTPFSFLPNTAFSRGHCGPCVLLHHDSHSCHLTPSDNVRISPFTQRRPLVIKDASYFVWIHFSLSSHTSRLSPYVPCASMSVLCRGY